ENLCIHSIDTSCGTGFPVGSIVAMDCTFADSLIKFASRDSQSLLSGGLIASLDGFVYFAEHGLEFRLDSVVAFTTFCVRDCALFRRFEISQNWSYSF